MRQRILVVEDEPAIRESVVYALSRDGYEAFAAKTIFEATERLDDTDLVLLDLMLPDGSGFDFIRRVRSEARSVPIIVLSSRDGEADRVAALETGADDYVTKPFSPREVVARVRAVLRRLTASARPPDLARDLPALRVDKPSRRAYVQSTELELTRVEFDVLSRLLETPGHVLTRTDLIDRIWGDGYAITDRTIDSHVKSLRKKVSDAGGDPGIIETVRGVGYRVSFTSSE
jgi:two-component system catabolic regulation response regulator CreB